MKKIDLSEYVRKSNFIKPISEKEINGGCTLVLGCNQNGYYTIRYIHKCSSNATVNSHTTYAKNYAKSHSYGPGIYEVTGKSYVTYLGKA